MSALVMRRALFIHIPKTGGSFVQHAIEEQGIRAVRPRLVPRGHRDHPILAYVKHYRRIPRHRFTFAFVRFPTDWVRSYWAYRMRTGWVPKTDALIQSDEFPVFVEKVLEHYPGVASLIFERYVGSPGAIDFVGRHESLREDLPKALELAGYEIDREKLAKAPAQNSSDYRNQPAEYSSGLFEALVKAERRGIERWYPERLTER